MTFRRKSEGGSFTLSSEQLKALGIDPYKPIVEGENQVIPIDMVEEVSDGTLYRWVKTVAHKTTISKDRRTGNTRLRRAIYKQGQTEPEVHIAVLDQPYHKMGKANK